MTRRAMSLFYNVLFHRFLRCVYFGKDRCFFVKNALSPYKTVDFFVKNENSAIKLSYPHPISFHYVAVKTVRRNDLEHKPKTNKNTTEVKLNICF